MADEIERKYLLRSDSWRTESKKQVFMQQAYLTDVKKSSVRVRIAGEKAYLNLKSATLGITRKEYEFEIPLEDGKEILEHLCDGPIIEKTRYYVPYQGHTWEIDEFKGKNTGLVVAEIELKDAQEEFKHPEWIGEEVSHDKRYYNVCLVKQPFNAW
jgi:adenylate cyclase